MKRLSLFVLFVFFMVGVVFAQEDPAVQINNLSIQIIQLQAQGQLVAQQYQDATEKYVDTKREIQSRIDKLRKELKMLQKVVKDTPKDMPAEQPKE